MNNVKNILGMVKCSIIDNLSRIPVDKSCILEAQRGINTIEIKRCSIAEKEHKKNFRQFCHTMHKDNIICCVNDTNYLTDENIAGILFHEIAHIVSEKYQDLIFQES
jgi:hypothetical protein